MNLVELQDAKLHSYKLTMKKDQKEMLRNFPGGAVVKNLPANAVDMDLSPTLGISFMSWSN